MVPSTSKTANTKGGPELSTLVWSPWWSVESASKREYSSFPFAEGWIVTEGAGRAGVPASQRIGALIAGRWIPWKYCSHVNEVGSKLKSRRSSGGCDSYS